MQLPEWMFSMIYRCLEKKPESRFASGMALHDYIVQNSVWFNAKESSEQVKLLKQENKKLLEQNKNLQIELQQLRSGKKSSLPQTSNDNTVVQPKSKATKTAKVFLWILAGLFVAAVFVYALQTNNKLSGITQNNRSVAQTDTSNNLSAEEQQQVNAQLLNAKNLWRDNNKEAALNIYQQLSQQNVPQAMFMYANFALQNKNDRINCNDAFALLEKANEKNYLPATTLLGFLYAYADDENTLKQLNYYSRCVFPSNVYKGAHLLMEATLQGDVTAAQWLDKLNTKPSNQ
jgi:TPR repeat protein